ncbi:MAG: NAD(P)-dependent oxidoreductase [Candidatus Peregrinibacteria bacterium]
MKPLPKADLELVFQSTQDLWEEFRNRHILITGATGFFGMWLLESFTYACDRLNLGMHIHALTRDSKSFAAKAPHLLSHPSIYLEEGDVRSFSFPVGEFTHVIHAAGQTRATKEQEQKQYEVFARGARHVLEFGRQCGAAKLLLISSGAVYGPQPSACALMPEDESAVQKPLAAYSAYAEGKREAERLWQENPGSQQRTIARSFALVGPHLPLDAQYAIGNFIRDGLAGRTLQIQGDGTPYRSYLYAADLVIWLLHILCRGQPCRAYNVGSEQAISIHDTARAVASAFSPLPEIEVLGAPKQDVPPERYVPSTHRARTELQLREHFSLAESIRSTISWYDDCHGESVEP